MKTQIRTIINTGFVIIMLGILGLTIIAIAQLSIPSIASTVTVSLYNIVDTFWVARLGHEAIAALTIVFPFQILFYALGIGTGIGAGLGLAIGAFLDKRARDEGKVI